jgi:hypothetical protein
VRCVGWLVFFTALPLGACAGSPPAQEPGATTLVTAPAARGATVQAAAVAPAQTARGPADPLTEDERKQRDNGIRAMDEGRFSEAAEIFAGLLGRHPGNAAATVLLDGVTKMIKEAQDRSTVDLANVTPRHVDRPPFDYALRTPVALPGGAAAPRLTKIAEAKNKIVDESEWFDKNALKLPEMRVPDPFRQEPGQLPSWVPLAYGPYPLIKAIDHGDHIILLFGSHFADGRFLAVVDNHHTLVALFDFSSFVMPPSFPATEKEFIEETIDWAKVDSGVLYVQNAHRTYAKSSRNQNAYITALDLASGALLWRSAPLVANAGDFIVRGSVILAGYGFTAEPDFLYVLDRATGKTLSRLLVKSGPEFLIEKENKLYVRTYDTDYVFELR